MKVKIKKPDGRFIEAMPYELSIIEKALEISRRSVIETTNEEVICDIMKWLNEKKYLTIRQLDFIEELMSELEDDSPIHEAWITDSGFIEITEDILEEGKSEAGGWNRQQLALLGVNWPPKRGWKEHITGKPLPESIVVKFLTCKK